MAAEQGCTWATEGKRSHGCRARIKPHKQEFRIVVHRNIFMIMFQLKLSLVLI